MSTFHSLGSVFSLYGTEAVETLMCPSTFEDCFREERANSRLTLFKIRTQVTEIIIIFRIAPMENIMLLILLTVLISNQARVALGLAEPQGDCSVDLRLMYTFMDEKFKMKDEIKQLKETLADLQGRLSIMEKKGNNMRCKHVLENARAI